MVKNKRDSSSDQRNRYRHHRLDLFPHILVIVTVCYPAVVDLKLMGSVGSKVTDGARYTCK